jgi:GNAT superfamily N-acetyltransferase
MAARRPRQSELTFHPLTPERWDDLAALFGRNGACGGCWCMWWRMKRADWEEKKGAANRRAFRKIVRNGEEPGVLAYASDVPVGWCAVAPREAYEVLGRSRILKPVDDKPVWSITCLFIARPWRKQGVSVRLIEAAVSLARSRGAKIVEGYPVEPRKGTMPDMSAFTGLPAAFERARFREVARRSETRPIMRRMLR